MFRPRPQMYAQDAHEAYQASRGLEAKCVSPHYISKQPKPKTPSPKEFIFYAPATLVEKTSVLDHFAIESLAKLRAHDRYFPAIGKYLLDVELPPIDVLSMDALLIGAEVISRNGRDLGIILSSSAPLSIDLIHAIELLSRHHKFPILIADQEPIPNIFKS